MNQRPQTVVAVRAVNEAEFEQVADVLMRAYRWHPLSSWLFRRDSERMLRLPGLLRLFARHLVTHGCVDVAADFAGVALWQHVTVAASRPGVAGIAEACGSAYPRFRQLDKVLVEHHPVLLDHAYLAFLGVNPDHQATGVGHALLRHRLALLDSTDTSAYLEASPVDAVDLFRRFGFRPAPPAIWLPNGPRLYPMWRDPQPSHARSRSTPGRPIRPDHESTRSHYYGNRPTRSGTTTAVPALMVGSW